MKYLYVVLLLLLMTGQSDALGTSAANGTSAISPITGGSVAATGSMSLSNGLILNWGPWTSAGSQAAVGVTFNLPFTTAAYVLTSSCSSASTTAAQTWYDTLTTSGANLRGQVGSLSCTYLAIGK